MGNEKLCPEALNSIEWPVRAVRGQREEMAGRSAASRNPLWRQRKGKFHF